MRVYRFMGADEAMRLCTDHTLLQGNDWHGLGYDSTSKGFTFGLGTSHDAVEASRWLKGVADMQYLLEADTLPETNKIAPEFQPCVGRYPDYRLKEPMTKKREIKEICTKIYSLDSFRAYAFYVCLGLLPNSGIVTLQQVQNTQFMSMMTGNMFAQYQKRKSFLQLNHKGDEVGLKDTPIHECDLTELQSVNERIAYILAKKKEADDKTREAFTK